MKRPEELNINIEDMSVNQKIIPGKVLVLILDGNKGNARIVESPEHGSTTVVTAKGKSAKVKFEADFLL